MSSPLSTRFMKNLSSCRDLAKMTETRKVDHACMLGEVSASKQGLLHSLDSTIAQRQCLFRVICSFAPSNKLLEMMAGTLIWIHSSDDLSL